MLLDTPLCDFGRKAPDFKLSSFDKSSYSLGQLVGAKGLLVAFICDHCPYVKAIVTNFVTDVKELQTLGIETVAIMPNDYNSYPADNPEKMGEFAKQQNFNFPYLVDDTQSVARAYGAVCTPDFFGFNAKNELQYRGRLEASQQQLIPDAKKELLEAMLQIAETGMGPKDQIPSIGCSIKWKE